jgi:hypothetical protein
MSLELIKASQHGLGHLLNPTNPEDPSRDWITQTWQWILKDELGLTIEKPDWLDYPAVGRLSVSSPHLHRLFRPLHTGQPYEHQIKPFNFLLLAFVHPVEWPADEQQMVLISRYSPDRADWLDQPWINRHSRKAYRITTAPSHGRERDGLVTVKTYRQTLAEYATHPEVKSGDLHGRRSSRKTRGLLARRAVLARTTTHIGKEANHLEETRSGLASLQHEAVNAYDDTELLQFADVVVPRLRDLPVREVARRTGYSPAAVHAVMRGRSIPRPAARDQYRRAIDSPSDGGGRPAEMQRGN